ncbi:MAG: RHS repeat protein [Acidobacteria bacterium]|nr:RHS repeat protein [Acidobacteriota bacterium]
MGYSYDPITNSTTVTDPAGKVKRYHYDVLGRAWKVVEPDGTGQLTQETTYNYLPTTGQNKLIIVQGVQTRTFNYDTLGRLTSETHPENGATSYTYDDNGNPLTKTDCPELGNQPELRPDQPADGQDLHRRRRRDAGGDIDLRHRKQRNRHARLLVLGLSQRRQQL